LMLLSTSKTALVITVVALSMIYFCRNFKLRGKIAVVVLDLTLMVAIATIFLVISFWVVLLTGLGKDPTISGRTPMWTNIMFQLQDRPWFGFGRGAFFAPDSPYAVKLFEAIHFSPPHAHNGFLELAVDVGVVGFVLFLVVFIQAYRHAIYRAFTAKNSGDLWPLGLLMTMTLNNLTESFLFHGRSVYALFLFAIVHSFVKGQRRGVLVRAQGQGLQGSGLRGSGLQGLPDQDSLGPVLPGQEVPGQEVPGQEVPGQEVPGQGLAGQTGTLAKPLSPARLPASF
jgi:exopolysaccharide production protein ExoQ